MTTNPSAGDSNPKNAADHATLTTSWPPKTMSARLLRGLFDWETRYAATPMSVKSVTQTGPKTQFGGANHGRTSVSYHDPIAVTVKTLPTTPASCARMTHPSSSATFRRRMDESSILL